MSTSILHFDDSIPFVQSSWQRVEIMMEFARIEKGEKAVDLGSGDGRLVIEMAKKGAEAHGFEIRKELVKKSRDTIRKANLSESAFIHHANFWGVNLYPFDVITIYGLPFLMARLGTKLEKEAKPGARIISNAFHIRTWYPKKQRDGVFLYIKY